MMPNLPFELLICTYFPGLPISVLLFSMPNIHDLVEDAQLFYFGISPFVIGIFVDGCQHCLGRYVFAHNKWLEKCTTWKNLARADFLSAKDYHEECCKAILSRHSILFAMYEFFLNSSISLFVVLVALLFFPPKQDMSWWYTVIALTFLSISFFFARVFRDRGEKYLKETVGPQEIPAHVTKSSSGDQV